jgi:hypothetical protein
MIQRGKKKKPYKTKQLSQVVLVAHANDPSYFEG